jgi:hypothetical protein
VASISSSTRVLLGCSLHFVIRHDDRRVPPRVDLMSNLCWLPAPIREITVIGFPVVSWPYIPAAEMPILAGARPVELRSIEEPGRRSGTWFFTMPGPLSDGDAVVSRRSPGFDQDVGKDVFLTRVERVVDGFLHRRE